MKKYRQLIKELPAKTVVFAFGRFNPPTTGHELLIKVVQKLAKSHKCDHVIYASRTQDKKKNPLSVDRKLHYLKLMFKGVNFAAATEQERTFLEVATALNKKYKNIIMVAGSDRVQNYEKLLNQYNGDLYNFDTIQVVSAGERDPDADDASGMSASKMRAVAGKGNYAEFKKGLPSSVRDIDGKLLMNEIRQAMGLEVIKEQVKFNTDELREKYFKGEIFHIGDLVESAGTQYEIVDRGSNYLVVVDTKGDLHRKWIKDVQIVEVKSFKQFNEDIQPGYAPKEITYKGYTTKNLHHSEDAAKAFQSTIDRAEKGLVPNDPVAILNALKHTDEYMKLNDMHLEQGRAPNPDEVQAWVHAHDMAKKTLDKIGEFAHHLSYWQAHKTELEFMGAGKPEAMEESLSTKTLKPGQDKLKVARVIADMLGVADAEKMSNPEQLVNAGLRKVKSKVIGKDFMVTISKMIDLANEVGIKYDPDLLQGALKEQKDDLISPTPKTSNYNIASDVLRYSDYMKLKKMNGGELPSREAPVDLPHTTPGHTLHSSDDHQMRRRKVKYATEEKEGLKGVCWKGYEAIGTKKKNGKTVPNCVPVKESALNPNDPHEDYLKKKEALEELALNAGVDQEVVNQRLAVLETEYAAIQEGAIELKKQVKVRDDSDKLNTLNKRIAFNTVFEEDDKDEDDEDDYSDADLDKMASDVSDDDIINHAYEDDELAIVDDETGEEIEVEDVKEEVLNEVLSRMERMRAKARFARTLSKRERRTAIALKKYSSTPVINQRARRLAIKLFKQRMARKPLNKLSIGEKERIEAQLAKRKQLINRLAMRMVPRIRKIETSRLTHTKYTAGKPAAVGI